LIDTLKTVLWGAIGIRRRTAHDQAKINPVHVAIIGVVFAVLFVVTLVTIVRIVTS
jgi:hypothetical protein